MFLPLHAIHILNEVTADDSVTTTVAVAAVVAVDDDTDIVDGEDWVTGDAVHGGERWGKYFSFGTVPSGNLDDEVGDHEHKDDKQDTNDDLR